MLDILRLDEVCVLYIFDWKSLLSVMSERVRLSFVKFTTHLILNPEYDFLI